jgi:predicted Ser/Thr protein kinase
MSDTNQCPECGAPLSAGAPHGLCPACLLKRGLETNTIGDATTIPPLQWMPPPVDEVAARFPELEILRLIGRGGMGAVYQARQKNLDRIVALKILPPEMAHDPAFAQRFAREAQAMARLNHPHIVTVFEFGQRSGWYFFIMEYVDGLNLRGVLSSGHVSPKEALAIVPQICDALQYAHEHGIVHRDIKPENILLNKQGDVKIADFGLVKLIGRDAAPEPVMGTPKYMAPEQREHPTEVDHRADIYSLGVVFYEMLTGELPSGKLEAPSRKVQIDVRLDEIVLRALQREPQRRYQHASDVKTQVETVTQTAAAGNRPGLLDATAPEPNFLANFLWRWCHIVELAFGFKFTSRPAITLTKISALGFVGVLSTLGFLEPVIPEMQVFFKFAAFFAFFSLLGLVTIIEFPAARRRAHARKQTLAQPVHMNRRDGVARGILLTARLNATVWLLGLSYFVFGQGLPNIFHPPPHVGWEFVALAVILAGLVIGFFPARVPGDTSHAAHTASAGGCIAVLGWLIFRVAEGHLHAIWPIDLAAVIGALYLLAGWLLAI